MGLIFGDEDLDAAVAAGALSTEGAASFRAFLAQRRDAPSADEESFRLLTGFNDIFVGIAVVLVLAALAWLADQGSHARAGAAVALASWGLAEFFTKRRRMALPSILLLLAFVGGVALAVAATAPSLDSPTPLLGVGLGGLAGALAAALHWLRFKVPITIAAGVAAVGGAGVVAVAALDQGGTVMYSILAVGLVAFALALAWDMSDPLRRTRRSDVAFWLHLLAAPAIVHSAFTLLGLGRTSSLMFGEPNAAALRIAAALALYLALAAVALIVDRRALMVSSLAYLIYAVSDLFAVAGQIDVSLALAGLVVGSGLLLLSAFWPRARRATLRLIPTAWRRRLPPVPAARVRGLTPVARGA